MPTSYLQVVDPKSRLAVWFWSPVIVLRVALFGTYLLYVYAALIAFLAGVPIFNLTAPDGYTSVWAILLGVSAVLCAIGSLTDRWQRLEKWSSAVLGSLLLAYIGGLNLVGFVEQDLDRQFVGAIAAIAGLLPITRFVYLAAQSGKQRVRVRI